MEVVRRDREQQELAYNVMCQRMSILAETIPPFEVTWSEISPLGFTFQHDHHGYSRLNSTVVTHIGGTDKYNHTQIFYQTQHGSTSVRERVKKYQNDIADAFAMSGLLYA